MSYLESWKAIELANAIFGFDGWSTSITALTVDHSEKVGDKHRVYVTAIVKVTLKDGSSHEDVGAGAHENKVLGTAMENAKKEAVSDSTKRALRMFGNALGNSIYDKQHAVHEIKAKKERDQKEREAGRGAQLSIPKGPITYQSLRYNLSKSSSPPCLTSTPSSSSSGDANPIKADPATLPLRILTPATPSSPQISTIAENNPNTAPLASNGAQSSTTTANTMSIQTENNIQSPSAPNATMSSSIPSTTITNTTTNTSSSATSSSPFAAAAIPPTNSFKAHTPQRPPLHQLPTPSAAKSAECSIAPSTALNSPPPAGAPAIPATVMATTNSANNSANTTATSSPHPPSAEFEISTEMDLDHLDDLERLESAALAERKATLRSIHSSPTSAALSSSPSVVPTSPSAALSGAPLPTAATSSPIAPLSDETRRAAIADATLGLDFEEYA